MSGKPVKPPATKNRPSAFGFVTQAFAMHFLNGPSPTFRNFNEKLKLAGAFNGAPAA
jgi:hypothetical protein